MIRIQHEDFDSHTEALNLRSTGKTGAVVTFIGLVRDFAQQDKAFFLQHYPGMTDKVLEKIEKQARERWPLLHTSIIHRVGELRIDDQIVFVGVSAAHRGDAFAACEFMIDILKTEAPFWKKEGGQWVEAKESDQATANRWLTP